MSSITPSDYFTKINNYTDIHNPADLDLKAVEFMKEFWSELILKLPPADLVRCSRVCSGWHQEIDQHPVWWGLMCSRYGVNKVENLESLFQRLDLSWKNRYSSYPILAFLVETAAVEGINGLLHAGFEYKIYEKCHVLGLSVSCDNACDARLITGIEGCELAKLAIGGDFLFALAKTGEVIFWNLKDEERERTPFVLTTTKVNVQAHTCQNSSFLVQDDLLLIQYNDIPFLEVVNYEKSNFPMRVYEGLHFKDCRKMQKNGNECSFESQNSATGQEMIKVFDLHSGEIVSRVVLDREYTLQAHALFGNHIYIAADYEYSDERTSTHICIYDRINNRLEVEETYQWLGFIDQIFVCGDFIFVTEITGDEDNEKNFTKVDVIDRKTMEIIYTTQRLTLENEPRQVDAEVAKGIINAIFESKL